MQFGIMDMQMNALIPAGKPPEGLMAQIAGFDHAALVEQLFGLGFNPVELGGDLVLFLSQSFSEATIQRLLQIKNEGGIRYTVHLPLWSVEPSTPLTPVRQGSVKALIESIQVTKVLQPEAYVLHATGALAAEFYQMRLPDAGKALILRQFQNGARQSIQTLLAETGIPSRQLALETIEFPFDLTMELAEEFDTSICLDTGHVLAGFPGILDFFETLERILPRLGEIHLHDCPQRQPGHPPGYGKDHQALGKGDLDLSRLLDRLVGANYHGPIIFELSVEEALASLEVVRSIRPNFVD